MCALASVQASGGLSGSYLQGCGVSHGRREHQSRGATIRPHLPRHRKHLAVYRKPLIKEFYVCLDLVTDDDSDDALVVSKGQGLPHS